MDAVVRYCGSAARAAAALMLASGLAVCVAWLAGGAEWTRLLPGSSVVHFNTGVLFAAAGASLLTGARLKPLAAVAGALLVLAIAGLTLLQYLLRTDLGVDTLFVRGFEDRMAPNTAATFVLAGLALLFLTASRRAPWAAGVVPMLGAMVIAVGTMALVGYALDLTAAFQWAGLTRMAVLTAGNFVLLGFALILAAIGAGPEQSWRERPWLAAAAGTGLAVLSALGWYTLRHAPDVDPADVASVLLGLGLVAAALLAGAIAQGRHRSIQAQQLAVANAALRDSEARLHFLLRALQTAVVVHGADTAIRYANPAAAAILGLTEDQLSGRTTMDPYWHFVREDGSPMPVDEYPVSRVFATRTPLQDYMVGIRASRDCPTRWVLVNAIPDVAPDGGVRQAIVSFIDITERKRLAQQLEQLALTDSLTGLATRRHFSAAVEREIARSRRAGAEMSLLILDVDHFKSINDTRGHAAGDSVLKGLAQTLRATLRDTDIAGRLGGEEFCVLLPQAGEDVALEIAERLRRAIEATAVPVDQGPPLRFTASIGVATLESADADMAAMLHRADLAMYQAKRAGRNQVRVLPHAVPAN